MTTDSHTSRRDTSEPSLFSLGVSGFAGVMLATVAVFQIFEGIAAIANDNVYVAGLNYTYEFDITAWGWIHLILGIVALATGIGILMGQTWGLITGVVIAALSCLSNFAFLPYFPIWSMVIIAFNALVIWALCTQLSHDPTA
jgi:hypothetical protein